MTRIGRRVEPIKFKIQHCQYHFIPICKHWATDWLFLTSINHNTKTNRRLYSLYSYLTSILFHTVNTYKINILLDFAYEQLSLARLLYKVSNESPSFVQRILCFLPISAGQYNIRVVLYKNFVDASKNNHTFVVDRMEDIHIDRW